MQPLKHRIQAQAYQVVYLQLLIVLIISLLVQLIFRHPYGLSIFTGGLAYTLPNFIFVWLVFRYENAQEMTYFLIAFMVGEAIKLILCGIFFLVIVKYLPISLLSVLGGLSIAMLSFWIASLWQFSKHRTF